MPRSNAASLGTPLPRLISHIWNSSLFCSSAALFNTLQPSATLCNTLQHSATLCNTLQHSATPNQHSVTLCSTIAALCNTAIEQQLLAWSSAWPLFHQQCNSIWTSPLYLSHLKFLPLLQHCISRFTPLQHSAALILCNSRSLDLLHDRQFTFPSAAMQLDLDVFQKAFSHHIKKTFVMEKLIAFSLLFLKSWRLA